MFQRILAALLLLIGMPAAGAVTLKIATVAPEGTTWMTEMRAGAGEITRRTDGRVSLKFYPGGVMGNDKAVLRKMRVGQLQGGAFTGGGLAEIDADTQIYSLPFQFRSYDEVDYVRSRMDAMIKHGLQAKGMTALGISEGGFAYIMSDAPIRRIADLEGRKVWVPEGDDIAYAVFQVLGISPVPLPLADVYTGLQTGLLDTVATSPMGAIAFQWYTRVRYLTDVPLVYLIGILAVDARAFAALKPADQAAVREVMGAVFSRLDRLDRQDNSQARKVLQHEGIRLVIPSPAELARWHGAADEALIRLGKDGAYSPAMLAVLQRCIKDYRSRPDLAHER